MGKWIRMTAVVVPAAVMVVMAEPAAVIKVAVVIGGDSRGSSGDVSGSGDDRSSSSDQGGSGDGGDNRGSSGDVSVSGDDRGSSSDQGGSGKCGDINHYNDIK